MTITSPPATPATPAILDAIERWHQYMRGELPDVLDDLLADDAVMY